MSTRNLNGKKDKLEIPKDFIPEEYDILEILRQYKKKLIKQILQKIYIIVLIFLAKTQIIV